MATIRTNVKKEVRSFLTSKNIEFLINGQRLYVKKENCDLVANECPYVIFSDRGGTSLPELGEVSAFQIPTSKELFDFDGEQLMTKYYSSKQDLRTY